MQLNKTENIGKVECIHLLVLFCPEIDQIYHFCHSNNRTKKEMSTRNTLGTGQNNSTYMNSKNKGIIMLLVAAVIVGIIGGVALITYMKPQKTTVYTFKDNYKAGTEVTSDMLSAVQCDSKIVTAGKKTDTSSRFVTGANLKAVLNSGDSLRMDVSEGMPLTLSMLSVNGGSTVEMNMDPTKVAVTVPVTNVSGVTNDLKEGSRVNIYAMGVDTPGTTLLFQNMRVINTQKDNGTLSSATIEVDVDQSLKLVYAANYSTIYLGLVDSTGYEATDNAEPSYVPDSNNGGN